MNKANQFRWLWFTFACVVCTAVFAQQKQRAPVTPPARSTQQFIADAMEAVRAGDHAKAAILFDGLSKRPDFGQSRPPVQLFLAAGDHNFGVGTRDSQELALQIYGMAGDLYGDNMTPQERALLRLRRAEVMMRQTRTDSAREEIALIRRKPLSRRALVYADLGDAELLLLANQPEAAKEKLGALVEVDDPLIASMAMFHLGRAYVQLKQTDEAVAVFRRLWNRYGESDMVKRAIFLVGQIYFDRGDFLEARKLYEACSVVGATMQTRVRPGDELIVKVSDPNHFNRTRSTVLTASLVAPSGDREELRLEKNPVSDQLYVGRIRTALAAATPGDGALQVSGADTIELSYGQSGKVHKVRVVDDGQINIDGIAMPDPPPRGTRTSSGPEAGPRAPRDLRPTVAAQRQSGDGLNPGSPVYVQIVDADLDLTSSPDTVKAEVVAQGGGKDDIVSVELVETGPRTGVFAGIVQTASSGPTITASSEAVGHPASAAMDVDRNSPAPATQPAEPVKALTFWQARHDDKAPFIEVDLHQPAALARLVWGAGDDKLAGKNAPTDLTITLKGDGPERVITLKDQTQPTDNVIDLKGFNARTIRFSITRFKGDAPAIGQIVITDTQGNQLVPSALAPANMEKSVLGFNVGQNVFARYQDELNETPGTPVVRTSRRLGARYHNGAISIAKRDVNAERPSLHPAWRLDLDASPHVLLNDPDLDTTPQPDAAQVEVFTESGDRQMLTLTETGASSGTFVAPLTLSTNPDAAANPRILHIRPGDVVWMKAVDERNMLPGYRTFRYFHALENRPTAGQWQSLPAIATAWPFEVATDEDADIPSPVPSRAPGKGRLSLAIHDADLMSNASTGASARVNALLGGASLELNLGCTGAGLASHQVDLVLGDPQAERKAEAKAAAATELLVAGDDIIRLAYTDALVPSADLAVRRAITEDEARSGSWAALLKPGAEAPAPVTPVIHLADPNRRVASEQEKQLAALRDEMNVRLAGYIVERKLFEERRGVLVKRQAAMPKVGGPATNRADAAATQADVLKATIASLTTQIDLLNGRAERLKALGAKEGAPLPKIDKAATQPAAQAPSPADAALVPGQAFEIVVDDPDLQGPSVDLRLRSIAGRLIDNRIIAAQRDASGKYRATVPTKSSDDPAQGGALTLVAGGEVIVDYQDKAQLPLTNVDRVAYIALASDAIVSATNAGYYEPIAKVRLGEPTYVQVIDFDADRSPGVDQVAMLARSSAGDRMIVILSETEPHSGVFRGKFTTDNAAANADDDVLQASYGGSIDLVYNDYLRESRDGQVQSVVHLPVAGGTDGLVEGFSRQFKDSQDEMKLWYRTGQTAYQIGRRLYLAGAYERADEYLVEATDYFSQLVSRFPADPMAASANYYLGNIQSLKGNHREALARFQEVVTRWPKSDFVARARFKVGQEMEALGYFDQAADAYVLLTYHHPDDAHVPMAMLRMMNHYERQKQLADAVSIAQKFVERFPKHERAGEVAIKTGWWLTESKRGAEAIAWFTQAEKQFAESEKYMPGLLCLHADALIRSPQGRARPGADRRDKVNELLNRVIFDYPKSPYVEDARRLKEQALDLK